MNNIRQLRKAAGLTMKELGKIVGMSESTISLYERGIHEPDIQTMGRLADALNVTVDKMLGRIEPDIKEEVRPITAQELKFALFGGDEGISDSDLEDVKRYAEFVRSRKNG